MQIKRGSEYHHEENKNNIKKKNEIKDIKRRRRHTFSLIKKLSNDPEGLLLTLPAQNKKNKASHEGHVLSITQGGKERGERGENVGECLLALLALDLVVVGEGPHHVQRDLLLVRSSTRL